MKSLSNRINVLKQKQGNQRLFPTFSLQVFITKLSQDYQNNTPVIPVKAFLLLIKENLYYPYNANILNNELV